MEVEDVFVRENATLSDVLRHFDDSNSDDDVIALPSPNKKMRMDAARGRSIDVRPAVQRRPLGREDGYMDTLEEARHASERPFSRQYMQQELARWMELEKWPYYQFIQLFAGASNSRVIDLMDQDDLERRLRERQEATLFRQREIERSVVPLKQKQEQLLHSRDVERTLRDNQKRLHDNWATQNLLEIGRELIDDCFVHTATALARLSMLGSGKPDQSLEADDEPDALDKIVAEKHVSLTQLVVRGCMRRALFELHFDHTSREYVPALVRCMQQGAEKNRARLAVDLTRTPIVKKEEEESTTTSSSTTTQLVTVELPPETVSGQEVVDVFGSLPVFAMAKFGCESEYGHYKVTSPTATLPYAQWAMQLIMTKDATASRELGQQYNIFASGGVDGQPPAVARLVQQAAQGASGEVAVTRAKQAMMVHFLWLYFHHRSLGGLALDAERDGDATNEGIDKALSALQAQLLEALQRAEPVLAQYFSRVRASLAGEKTLTGDAGAAIVRLPYTVTELKENATFEQQNEAMRDVNHLELIVDDGFALYYQTGKTVYAPSVVDDSVLQAESPLAWLRPLGTPNFEAMYPVLALYALFRGYAAYERMYRRHLGRRIQQQEETSAALERKIDDISREINSTSGEPRRAQYVQTRAFTAQPVNSGYIKLEPQAVNALDKAFALVERFCPGLRGIKKSELEDSGASIESGMGGDYARLAGMLLAEIRLVFPDQYKSQHQENYTKMSTTSALNAVKRYRYSRGQGVLRFWTEDASTSDGDYTRPSTLLQLLESASHPGTVQLSLF